MFKKRVKGQFLPALSADITVVNSLDLEKMSSLVWIQIV